MGGWLELHIPDLPTLHLFDFIYFSLIKHTKAHTYEQVAQQYKYRGCHFSCLGRSSLTRKRKLTFVDYKEKSHFLAKSENMQKSKSNLGSW